MNISFSIIIPWVSGELLREEAFKNLLNCLKVQEYLKEVNANIAFELVIVEQVTPKTTYYANKKIKELLPEEFAGAKYIQLLHDSESFNKSWCVNVAMKKAYHDHIIVIDADSLFGKDYLKTIKDYVENTHEDLNKIMITWNTLVCLPGKDNPIVRYVSPLVTKAMGGVWYTWKPYFLQQLGGMNENYSSYGGEDNDLYERAILLQKNPITLIPYTLVHQYHSWKSPAFNADYLFNISLQNAYAITERLKSTDIGNPKHPTLIDMSDLPHTKL